MPEPDSPTQQQIAIDPRPPADVTVPDRDVDSVFATLNDVYEGDSVALTIGYDDTVQDVELLVDEVRRDGGKLNTDWTREIVLVAKVVPPNVADGSEDDYLQVFVTGTPSVDDEPPWFVYSYRIKKSTGEAAHFVDPESGDKYPSCFAHGWVVEARDFFGGNLR